MKSNKTKQERRLTVQLVLAVSIALFGCAMIVAAFIVPPTGEIHPSVLTALGELLTFAGAVMGIDYRYNYRQLNNDRNRDGRVPKDDESDK